MYQRHVKDQTYQWHAYRLITTSDNEGGKFTLYFLAYVDKVPESEEEKKKLVFSIPGVLELTQ